MQSHANPICFCPVINEALFEPRVFQGLLGCDPLLGVVDKDLPQQVQKLTVEGSVDRNEFLHAAVWLVELVLIDGILTSQRTYRECLHCTNIFP